jgi:hypothetical protein
MTPSTQLAPPPTTSIPPRRPRPAGPRVEVQAQKRPILTLRFFLFILWGVIASAAFGYGWRYYSTPLAERAFAEKHELLAPSGLIGHSLGIAGSLMMIVGVSMYSLRKRLDVLRTLGRLSAWLEVHIFLCTLGPFLVLLHTSFRFGGIVSISFWSMTAVVLSGVFGRYVYVRIPKTIHGQFRSLQSIESQHAEMIETIAERANIDPKTVEVVLGGRRSLPKGLLAAIGSAIRFDLRRRKRTARVRSVLSGWKVPAHMHARLIQLVEKQAEAEQQIVLLQPFQRLFRYWHVFHLPLAIVMFLILIVHVAVAAAFGYAWPHP